MEETQQVIKCLLRVVGSSSAQETLAVVIMVKIIRILILYASLIWVVFGGASAHPVRGGAESFQFWSVLGAGSSQSSNRLRGSTTVALFNYVASSKQNNAIATHSRNTFEAGKRFLLGINFHSRMN